MRIDRVSHCRVAIALHETFRTAIRETDSVAAIRIEIAAGDRVGVGYATATPAITGDTLEHIESLIDEVVSPFLLSRILVPKPAYEFGLQSDDLFGIPIEMYGAWTAQCSSGMAGIDLALHSLVGTFAGRPQPSLTTSVTVGAGSIEEMVATAQRRVAAGFRVVKAKLGADPAHDAQRLVALAQALGAARIPDPASPTPVPALPLAPAFASSVAGSSIPKPALQFWVDANQGWTVAQALEIFDAALDANVVLGAYEQPTPADDLEGLRQVRIGVQQRCRDRGVPAVPVVADESARTFSDVDRIIALKAADAINVKFMKFGGITGSGQAVEKARAAGLGVLVGSMMEHPHSVAAALRFASLLGGVHDLDAGWWARDTSPLRYRDGIVSVEQ